MKSNTLIIKLSPFVLIKRLAVVEFTFAFLPAMIALLLGAERYYAATAVNWGIPFSFILTFIVTVIQISIIAIVFFWWYVPSYFITEEQIVHIRGGIYEPNVIARTFAITHIEVHQGALGRRFDYGSLTIYTSDMADPVHIHNIPNPAQNSRLIGDLIIPELALQTPVEIPPAMALIASGETQYVEFKASLQWDYRQQKRNKDLYEPVMKNLAAFMNTVGGTVLIGVSDDGEVLGLEPDYKTMGKKDSDGFENIFNMAFNTMIGAEFRQYVDVEFPIIADKEICLATARPATEPVFLVHKGQEKFYIRTGNTSQWLTVSKAAKYIQNRFNSGPEGRSLPSGLHRF